MTVPTHNMIVNSGNIPTIRVMTFTQVRILGFHISGSISQIRLGLVANNVNYACFRSQTTFSTTQFINTMPLSDVTYLHWDFGDGTTTTGISPTHSYVNTGIFTVTLSISDTLNRSAYAYGKVTVNQVATQTPTSTPTNTPTSTPIPRYDQYLPLVLRN